MGQLSLFDAFGADPNPVPKPPRPPKRNENEMLENKAKNQPEKKAENPAFVIEAPIETPPVSVQVPPTPSHGFYYEPPLYEAPIVSAPPLIEATEETSTTAKKTTEIGISEALPVSPIELAVIPVTETTKATEVKTKTALKPTTKAVPPLSEDSQEEAPSVIDTASLTKQYYSISEVAKMFSVNASHLRYWEKEFPTQLGHIRKNGKGDRFYTPKNIAQLQVIFHLVRNKKMTLEGARKHLKLKKKTIKAEADAYDLLQQVADF